MNFIKKIYYNKYTKKSYENAQVTYCETEFRAAETETRARKGQAADTEPRSFRRLQYTVAAHVEQTAAACLGLDRRALPHAATHASGESKLVRASVVQQRQGTIPVLLGIDLFHFVPVALFRTLCRRWWGQRAAVRER